MSAPADESGAAGQQQALETLKGDHKRDCTVFVRNLPFDMDDDGLAEAFQDAGPVRHAFVVVKGGQSKGFGFVQYALATDVENAVKQYNGAVIAGRRVLVEKADANKKLSFQKNKSFKAGAAASASPSPAVKKGLGEVEGSAPEHEAKGKVQKMKKKKKKKKARRETLPDSHVSKQQSNVIVVAGMEPDMAADRLNALLAELECQPTFVLFPSAESTKESLAARLEFATHLEAQRAVVKLERYHCVLLPSHSNRLIVRNLAWNVDYDSVYKHFAKYGPVDNVHIPKPAKGFCFVQFRCLEHAATASRKSTGRRFAGRLIAVDFALSKDQFHALQVQHQHQHEAGERDDDHAVEHFEEDDEDDDDDNDGDNDGDSDGDNDGDDDDDDDDDVGSDEGDDEDEDMDDADDAAADSDDDAKPKPERKSDVEKGTTLFIRNVSFETTEDALLEHFGRFGRLKYAKIVMDKTRNRPRGSAFVQFWEKENAETALGLAKLQSPVMILDGRQLDVNLAVTRERATQLTQANPEASDKRNLYLAREGVVSKDSTMSEADRAKRAAALKVKRDRLKNPNFKVSRTRLSVRNLPPLMDEKALRQLFYKAARDNNQPGWGSPTLKQVKIERDKGRVDSAGNQRSRRFGFVEFERHEHALAALRHLNNNPSIFHKNSRPIVEFALDDARKLLVRKRKMEARDRRKKLNFLTNDTIDDNKGNNSGGGTSRKQAALKKRKMAIIHTGTENDSNQGVNDVEMDASSSTSIKKKKKKEKNRQTKRSRTDSQSADWPSPTKKQKQTQEDEVPNKTNKSKHKSRKKKN